MSRRSDNPAAKIIVRNYPLTSTDKEFRDMFEKIGEIDDFFMPRFRDSNKPRGFFFVQFRKEDDAHDAIKTLNGKDVGGMKLAIEMVRGDKRERDRGGRDSWRGGDRDSWRGQQLAMADEELKKYSWEEIKEHRSSESTWIVVDGKVYDVTEFLDEHPGGEEVMMEHAGRDATEAFEDVGHSPDAKDIQKKYLIGEVAEEKLGKKPQTSGNTASGDSSSSSSSSSSNKPASTSWSTTSLVLLFLVLLAAYVYRNYTHIFGTEQKGQ